MNRSSTWLAAAALLGSGIGIGWYLFARPPRSLAETRVKQASAEESRLKNERIAEELSRLEQRVGEIRKRVSLLEAQGAAAKDEGDAARSAADRESAPSAEASLTLEEKNQLILENALTSLAAAMRQAPPDRGREERARSALRNVLAKPELSGSSLAEVSCTTALCKYVLDHDSEEDRLRFMQGGGATDPSFDGNFFFHYFAEAKQTVLYMSRPGQPLPVTRPAF